MFNIKNSIQKSIIVYFRLVRVDKENVLILLKSTRFRNSLQSSYKRNKCVN